MFFVVSFGLGVIVEFVKGK